MSQNWVLFEAIADALKTSNFTGELVLVHEKGSSVTWIGAPDPAKDMKITVSIEPLSKAAPPSARGM